MKKAKKFDDHFDALATDWESIKNAFANTAEDVTEMADDVRNLSAEELKEQAESIQQRMADYAAKNPMRTLGIALAAGLIIGWYLKK